MQKPSADQIESKAIVYEQPHYGMKFPILLTAFDTEYTDFGDKSGFRGKYVMFTIADGGVNACFYDPYSADFGKFNPELKQFLLEVRAGYKTNGEDGIPWESLEHDETYSREDFDSVGN